LDLFTERRKVLAAGARAAGQPAAAKEIAGLRKPTRSAWAVNRLVRADPSAAGRLAALGDDLRAAEAALDGPRIRELSQARRELVDALVRQALSMTGEPAPSARARPGIPRPLPPPAGQPGRQPPRKTRRRRGRNRRRPVRKRRRRRGRRRRLPRRKRRHRRRRKQRPRRNASGGGPLPRPSRPSPAPPGPRPRLPLPCRNGRLPSGGSRSSSPMPARRSPRRGSRPARPRTPGGKRSRPSTGCTSRPGRW
jgi:hypothetical protein